MSTRRKYIFDRGFRPLERLAFADLVPGPGPGPGPDSGPGPDPGPDQVSFAERIAERMRSVCPTRDDSTTGEQGVATISNTTRCGTRSGTVHGARVLLPTGKGVHNLRGASPTRSRRIPLG
jgi:hypothetical protein